MKTNKIHNTVSLILNNLKKHIYLATALFCVIFSLTSFCLHSYITPYFYVFVFFLFVLAGMYIYAKVGFDRKKLPRLTAAVLFGWLMLCVTVYFCERYIEVIRSIGFLILFLTALNLFLKKKLTYKNILILIFLCGVLLRVTSVLINGIDTKQHDMGVFSENALNVFEYDENKIYTMYDYGAGHAGYIEYIFHHMSLPDFDPRNVWSFYNPPFFHIVAAIWLRIAALIIPDYALACESIKAVPLYCAIVTLIFAYKLFRTLGLKKQGMVVACSVVSFSNALIYLSYNVNNDSMSTMFMLGSILYCLKWYKKQSFKNIIISALFLGFGMMTKLSVFTVAPAIAFIFICTFFKNKSYKKYLSQFAAFLAVSVPLGIWYPVKNYIRFGIPFSYVQTIEGVWDKQNISNVPIFQRLFGDFDTMFSPPWVHIKGVQGCKTNEANPLIALFKTSVFEEYNQFKEPFIQVIGVILLFCVIILGVVGFIKMIITLLKKYTFSMKITDIFLIILYFSMMTSYYIFCFKYPYSCSQHIRYVSPIVVVGAFYVGNTAYTLNKKKTVINKVFLYSLYAVLVMFCAMSIQI